MRELPIPQASADTQGGLIHPHPSTEMLVMGKQVSLCRGRVRGLHPFVLQPGKVQTLCPGAERHTCDTDRVFHTITSFPFLQKASLGPWPGRLLTA